MEFCYCHKKRIITKLFILSNFGMFLFGIHPKCINKINFVNYNKYDNMDFWLYDTK